MTLKLKSSLDDLAVDWRIQLAHVVETVREMSRLTDPQAMVAHYRRRVRQTLPVDASVSLSRRDLAEPQYRITRSTSWKADINPWKEPHRLPLLAGGILGQLIWADEPRIIDDLVVDPDDPAHAYLDGYRSLAALPLYDGGAALNMVILLRRPRAAFAREDFPNLVLTGNLFGRATQNLVLAGEVRAAYDAVDAELKAVADIQHALLPKALPAIPTMQLAAHYQTARRAGGDYYDFFALPDERWGILIADVSGHGTPAAVLMAVTHTLVHADLEPTCCPGKMLDRLNDHLVAKYTGSSGHFVTAFYGVYDARKRELNYASAGHNPPRIKRCADGSIFSLDAVGGLPLGVLQGEAYATHTQRLQVGDQIIFFTDGITEATNPAGEMFGPGRLDAALGNCMLFASDLIAHVLDSLTAFTAGQTPEDDRTMVVAKIT